MPASNRVQQKASLFLLFDRFLFLHFRFHPTLSVSRAIGGFLEIVLSDVCKSRRSDVFERETVFYSLSLHFHASGYVFNEAIWQSN